MRINTRTGVVPQQACVQATLAGVVARVTFHNPVTGWSVLRVEPFGQSGVLETVTVHQTQVFAGATMAFSGGWREDSKYGRQFCAVSAVEKKPASAAALEKYLGSGLIKGVGPKTARKIVKYFQHETLEVFGTNIQRLKEVPGIAERKLQTITQAWREHSKIRDVMMFLQHHGISTLFAVRIYKAYGDEAIGRVQKNPYGLADDFYGIGFFSADKVALSIGVPHDSPIRVQAAIKHVLSASREQGHCYLTVKQIIDGVLRLINKDISGNVDTFLAEMLSQGQMCVRQLNDPSNPETVYYARSLYYQEASVAKRLQEMTGSLAVDSARIERWVQRYCQQRNLELSADQSRAVFGIMQQSVSILTGGPGCGKTTTTQVFAKLLEAMGKRIVLVAPTGRAAQRMSEVIGRPAKTIHRLLRWQGGAFQVNEDAPLEADVVIIDECSMLDITLAHAILQALPKGCQLVLIGDPDQLPSVGPGNVLRDLIESKTLACFRLNQVFRQALDSQIIHVAHQVNRGEFPTIESPFHKPVVWQQGVECLFIDSEEITQAQQAFIRRVKRWAAVPKLPPSGSKDFYDFRCDEPLHSAQAVDFEIPKKFEHVDLDALKNTSSELAALKVLLNRMHPWSSLLYDLTAVDVIKKLYAHWVPKYYGNGTEIQVLSPMARGTVGTVKLNQSLQHHVNPQNGTKAQLVIGQRVFRVGDRVIHRRNNYELNVYNGDIGCLSHIDTLQVSCDVRFEPDGRVVHYRKDDLMDLDLAYATTIHKAQGSEFEVVIIPLLAQHFSMLYRNLIYTGLTRAKRLAVFVGSRRALAMAVKNADTAKRQTALAELLALTQ